MKTIGESKLLVDGVVAFEEILNCINAARSSILINMFIWREDAIGIRLANAVLSAAGRGVRVTISVDRVGMILERCEEQGRSFFHRNPDVIERFKIAFLKRFYPENFGIAKKQSDCPGLLERILSHPNIVVERERKKNDHSKYYVIDDSILILGGINVEDKECGADCSGRIYQDYMLKLEGRDHVQAFFGKLRNNCDTADGYYFRMNNKTLSEPKFEMKDSFLSIINNAKCELVIVMAYFAPLPSIIDAIVAAWKRGVKIRILTPENPNFQKNSNRKTLSTLMKRCSNDIDVVFSPKMVHTKLIFSEKSIMFGSCNITNLAFRQLGELDIELENIDTPLVEHINSSVEENFAISRLVSDYRQIKFSPTIAWLEGLFN